MKTSVSDTRSADCELITPYGRDRAEGKAEQVREMFDNIAPAYDFMNRAMTFGIDRLWRRRALGKLRRHGAAKILDVATGTADLAILMARQLPGSSVTGVDLSEGMIAVGRRKVDHAGLADRITLRQADCLSLPFEADSFDAVTVAYGVRNFANLAAGYAEMARVLRPGGLLTVIELSTPQSPLIRPLYNLYTRCIIPAAGRLVSHDTRAYAYLPESIAAVPQGEAMLRLMQQAGLTQTAVDRRTFGTCSIYTAIKPINQYS